MHYAYPNMIRLGYTSCATCHVSPQGGGVLTRYGRGIDYAQTIRAGEPPDAEVPSGRSSAEASVQHAQRVRRHGLADVLDFTPGQSGV